MKHVISSHKSATQHWVGDGFPVHSLFSYHQDIEKFSPFLLLDYAAPTTFQPTQKRRGVGEHPHRGFETVTIVYDGEVEHGDSVGNHGVIGPGDVQWMSAASGIIHTEMHSQAYTQKGGPFEMVQLWVNLPARHKMSSPKYQELLKSKIPVVPLADGAGQIRVIAGQFEKAQGPAQTFTPINVWDLRLKKNKKTTLTVPGGYTTAVAVLTGQVTLSEKTKVSGATVALLDPRGNEFSIEAQEESKLLILNGAPIHEPVVGYGPFVMNRKDEIDKAIFDFHSGQFIKS